MDCVDWSTVAANWDRHREGVETMKTELTEHLLAELGDLTGARVLELGSGTGELAARLAEAVGPTGHVLARDVAPGMVELERGRLQDLPNAEVARLDAGAIDQPADSFDAVVFRMGLMLVPDPALALEEIRRVLRRDGRLAVAVWGPPQDNPWLTALGMSAVLHGVVPGPPLGPGTPFSLADPAELEKLVRNAGFGEVTVTSVKSVRRFSGADEHFEMVSVLAPPLAAALGSASAETFAAVRRTFEGLVAQYATEDGALELPVHALACVAR
jgi:SAM-dependent methyltransferase